MLRLAVATALFIVSAAVAPSWAMNVEPSVQPDELIPNAIDMKALNDGQTLLSKASAVVARFTSDAKMAALMRQAKGVFVIPEFGHANSVPGGHWGAGVLLANSSGHWSEPALFTIEGGSLGPQTIANGGTLMLFVMSDRAMARFRSGSNWSLNSAPGSNIVNYSAATPQDMSGVGADIVAWSASGGPHADTQVSITNLAFDVATNRAVYGTSDLRSILASRTPYTNPSVISMTRQMPSPAKTAIAQNATSGRG